MSLTRSIVRVVSAIAVSASAGAAQASREAPRVVFFVAAAWYIDYHMVSDEPQYIAYERMTHIGRFIRDYVADVANLDRRPVVDKPKPEPNGLCRQ